MKIKIKSLFGKQLIIPLSILLFLALGTIVVILYGKGYRFGFANGQPKLLGTGLLVATSLPNGAEVYINGHLTTATDNTINLAPGEYKVKIFKQGYFPWEKTIIVQEEVVAKADALLFPTAPQLESITSIGVQSPTVDPSGTQIAYTVASQSARKNGVYVLDMSSRPILTLQSASIQVEDDTIDTFSRAQLAWSPDGKQLLASISGLLNSPTMYLLSSSSFNQNPQDVTATLLSVQSEWDRERKERQRSKIVGLKPTLQKMITENFKIIAWSPAPEDTKILYQASESATLPIIIKPRLIGANSTKEERDIKKGEMYVYDIKEDRNYHIDVGEVKFAPQDLSFSSPLRWLPDSKHLLFVHEKKIDILEYDNTNVTTIYAGPFLDSYVFPWPNGSKILIVTNLGNPNIPPNLYTISLK